MNYQHNTYDRRIQIGASYQRRKDAEALHQAKRWAGAIYLAGYTIECSLCALICAVEGKNNLKDTRMFKRGVHGATLHNLAHLLEEIPIIQKAITLDRSGTYKEAWNVITKLWQKDELRYWDKLGNEKDSRLFIASVTIIHNYILEQESRLPYK